MRLSALWDDVHARVDRYNKLYQSADAKWAEMKHLLEVRDNEDLEMVDGEGIERWDKST